MENGILALTDTALKVLKQEHSKSAPTTEEGLLPDHCVKNCPNTEFFPVRIFPHLD